MFKRLIGRAPPAGVIPTNQEFTSKHWMASRPFAQHIPP